jgi:hypothetical protein
MRIPVIKDWKTVHFAIALYIRVLTKQEENTAVNALWYIKGIMSIKFLK